MIPNLSLSRMLLCTLGYVACSVGRTILNEYVVLHDANFRSAALRRNTSIEFAEVVAAEANYFRRELHQMAPDLFGASLDDCHPCATETRRHGIHEVPRDRN